MRYVIPTRPCTGRIQKVVERPAMLAYARGLAKSTFQLTSNLKFIRQQNRAYRNAKGHDILGLGDFWREATRAHYKGGYEAIRQLIISRIPIVE